ncbi:hypothetical protein L6452_10292 [Arctium lappa]|uniref:Uncharacterized protein n=1 Tax=Arctium lappa TaxID=4217 RepID=A0ACB9DN27_ARCLA|nr:hypothetical protein L6452_10292 [Arctium lappa]
MYFTPRFTAVRQAPVGQNKDFGFPMTHVHVSTLAQYNLHFPNFLILSLQVNWLTEREDESQWRLLMVSWSWLLV